MKVINNETTTAQIGALQPHPRNPRQGDVGAIFESIEANGFYGSVVAQKATGYILAGNHRWLAAAQAGATEIPVTWVDVDDATALRILLADNRTNDLASYDENELAKLLQEIMVDAGSLAGTGYDGDALDELLADLGLGPKPGDDPGAQVDRAEELREKWGTERGQVWAIPSKTVLGKSHRLMCGDSTSAEDVGRLLGGAEPRLMVTDPPYGVEYDPKWREEYDDYKRHATGKVANDDRIDWRTAWALSPAPVAWVSESLVAEGFEIRAQVVWTKQHFVFGRGHYHWKHEPCWYAVRKGKSAEWKGDRTQTTVWEIANLNPHGGARDQPPTGHGTQKPLECMQRPIRNHKGDVYDPFVGSGTTLVAAETERRTCYAMEIDPGYVAVILERMVGCGLSPARVTRDEK